MYNFIYFNDFTNLKIKKPLNVCGHIVAKYQLPSQGCITRILFIKNIAHRSSCCCSVLRDGGPRVERKKERSLGMDGLVFLPFKKEYKTFYKMIGDINTIPLLGQMWTEYLTN